MLKGMHKHTTGTKVDLCKVKMLAKQSIKKGSILLREQPFIYILNSSLRTERCDNCFKKGELSKCSNCQYVYYCGKICQKEGWPLHKGECHSLKKIVSRIVPDAARLLARLIRKLNKGGDGVRSYYARDRFRMFKDLMSHYNDLKIDERRLEHFTSLRGVLHTFLGDTLMPNPVELLGIFGRMCINSFNIIDPEMKTLGTGIYLAASILDHSCDPTAVVTFEGTTLYIRSLRDMDCLDWTKVHISYIDTLNKPKDRQDELEKQYYFLCKCPKCIDDTILEIMTAASCQNDNCDGYVNMCNVSANDVARCGRCNVQLTKELINKYLEITEMNDMHLLSMNNLNYLDVCKICLEKSKGILHKLNIQRVKLLDASFESSIDLQQWEDAKNYGTQLLEGYLFYYNDLHPLVGLLYTKLSKVYLLFNERKAAQSFLKKGFEILKVTHGIESSLFRKEIKPLIEQLAINEANQNSF